MQALAIGRKAMRSEQCAMSTEPTRLAANRQFGRYGPMESHEVRQADVTGQSLADQVKRTRKMLREMDPETVKQVIELHRDLTFFEALDLAKREGKLIVPNDIHDRILTETNDREYFRENYPVWTGTLVIYEAPGKKLGKEVVFSWEYNKVKYSISFKVPKQFRGLRNCALIVEYPDFELINLKDNKYELKLLEGANILLLENFPKESFKWYKPDPETKIPIGEPVEKSEKDARYLCRREGAYLGSLARGDLFDYDSRRDVDLEDEPSVGLEVALVPLAAAPKEW